MSIYPETYISNVGINSEKSEKGNFAQYSWSPLLDEEMWHIRTKDGTLKWIK